MHAPSRRNLQQQRLGLPYLTLAHHFRICPAATGDDKPHPERRVRVLPIKTNVQYHVLTTHAYNHATQPHNPLAPSNPDHSLHNNMNNTPLVVKNAQAKQTNNLQSIPTPLLQLPRLRTLIPQITVINPAFQMTLASISTPPKQTPPAPRYRT
ncbi:hypothetical protein EJ03DRAFT_86428 [Teratosphaeria nubilosa]|uniref:Uncharacterized protein n=1 Tax=Teratosphaeria nubilosa TaxID=161662 RepID=A0A6G1LBE6_9PEZI|nr:hypothetical protein EJ03DRAFT_86428 [Teratosphaeria nubilosa]